MTEFATDTIVKTKIMPPSLYKVLLLNDDKTPMEFVVDLLIEVFGKSEEEAEQLMWEIHTKGRGIAGVYTKDIAFQKHYEALTIAAQFGHPLQVKIEKL